MKSNRKFIDFFVVVLSLIIFYSCTKDDLDSQSTPEITTGEATFWAGSNLGVGNITVTCNGSSQIISGYYDSVIPSCGAASTANFNLYPGTYSYSAIGGSSSWNGTITVTSGGCSKIQLTGSGTGGNLSLNGRWSRNDIAITISGSNGVFNAFYNGNWKSAADKGFVKLGDLYLKNISNVNSTKWNAQPLWVFGTNGMAEGVKWGTDGTIVMSSDGNTFTITGTSPLTGVIGSATFTRVN